MPYVNSHDNIRIGWSTGAFPGEPLHEILDVLASIGCDTIELSALRQGELAEIARTYIMLRDAPASRFPHITLHGPAKDQTWGTQELVSALGTLDAPVVMHPDSLTSGRHGAIEQLEFREISLWSQLGSNLRIENNDSRKTFGQTPEDLRLFFALLPEARMCLDISHAWNAGGPNLVDAFAREFSDRIAQIHVGCASGEPVLPEISRNLSSKARLIASSLNVPVIIERTTPLDDHDLLVRQHDRIASQ